MNWLKSKAAAEADDLLSVSDNGGPTGDEVAEVIERVSLDFANRCLTVAQASSRGYFDEIRHIIREALRDE